MVRGKVELKRIANSTSRQVTFSKRRNWLLKKAYELSVLCDAEVALIIFSQKGRLYHFSSSNMQMTIERYRQCVHDDDHEDHDIETEQRAQILEHEASFMMKKIEVLENSHRKLTGRNLGNCCMEELQEIENQLERGLENIRDRKSQLFEEEMEKLVAKEKILLEENARLSQKCGLRATGEEAEPKEIGNRMQSSEVVTELFIGPPSTRNVSLRLHM